MVPAVLRSPNRHWRQRLAINMASRFAQLGSPSMLCVHRMLAYRSLQQRVWTSWYYIHHLYVFCACMLLASFHKYLVAHVYSAICSRLGYRSQIGDGSNIRSRNHTTKRERCACDVMANVHGFWHHAGICCGSRILSNPRFSRDYWLELASHDGLCNDACCHRCLLCLPVPRVSALVFEQEQTPQGIPIYG